MDRHEFELKRALARREPAPDFTSRVMSSVRAEGEAHEAGGPQSIAVLRQRSQAWRWAAVGALAASLMLGVVVEQRRTDRQAAELAEAQLYETLLLAGEKMHQAREGVRGVSSEGESR